MASENQLCSVSPLMKYQEKKYTKTQEKKHFENIHKSVLSHVTFYLKDDDHEAVGFNGETISLLVN